MRKSRNVSDPGRIEHRIIAAVYKHPMIYNPSHANFKNYKAREAEWSKIVQDFEDVGLKEDDLKKKWRSLRDCYHKYLRAKFISPNNASLLYRYKYWQWAGQMAVFKPYFVQYAKKLALIRGTKAKILTLPDSEPETFDDEPEPSYILKNISREPAHDSKPISPEPTYTSRTSSPGPTFTPKPDSPNPSQSKKRKYRKPVKKVDREKEIAETYSQVANEMNEKSFVEKKIEQNNDAIDLLFLSYAKTVKKFSEERQVITKFKISQLLMQQELAQLKENAGYSITSTEIELDPIQTAEELPEVVKYEHDSDEDDFSN